MEPIHQTEKGHRGMDADLTGRDISGKRILVVILKTR